MDTQEFTRQLADEGFDEVVTNTRPAGAMPAHTHAFAVKALVTDGEITLGVSGRQTTYRAGDVFTMAAGCEHSEVYGADGVTYVAGRKHQRA